MGHGRIVSMMAIDVGGERCIWDSDVMDSRNHAPVMKEFADNWHFPAASS